MDKKSPLKYNNRFCWQIYFWGVTSCLIILCYKQQRCSPIGPLKPEQIAKLLSELDVVRRNLDVMNELLVEKDPGKESLDDFQLMKELHQTTTAMQEWVTGLIRRVTDEILLGGFLLVHSLQGAMPSCLCM